MLIQHLPTVGSTSDAARALARQHPGQVVLVRADMQTAGRGSHGRAWCSPVGGAWFSLAVPMLQPEAATPMRVGQALARVLTRYADGITIKPPNDLLIAGRKIAGILCEQDLLPGSDNQPTVIIGVGINVNLDPAELGDDLRMPATSLREQTGRGMDDRGDVVVAAEAIVKELGPAVATA